MADVFNDRGILAVAVGGFIAGVLDICSVIGVNLPAGVSPVRILQSVASGAYGKAAYQGGAKTAAIGLGFHFLIAFTAALVFFLASRWLTFMTRHWFWCGLLFGELVFLFMNYVVLPLSAIGHPGNIHRWELITTGPLGHPLTVGLPIAWAVQRWAAASVTKSAAV